MNHPDRSTELKAELLLLITVLVWAANYPLAKYCINGMNIFIFNAIRYFMASLVLIILFLWRSTWISILKADRKRLLEAGIVAHIIYQIAFIVGLNMTTAGNSAVLLSTSPLWTVVLHSRLHKESVRPKVWAGMLISFVGVVMIVIGSGKKFTIGGTELIGDIIALAAAVLWAWNTNLQKPLVAKYSALQLSMLMVSMGGIGLTAMAIPAAMEIQWSAVHWTLYAGAIASGLFSIGIGNAIWSYGVKHLGPGRTGGFGNLIPVVAFVLSYFTLHESVLPIQMVGAGITVLGVWIVRN
ncbi:MAG: DMT family transporter [Bacteroidota bacterium]